MSTVTFKVWNSAGALADADSVPVLFDRTGTYGIKRNDTGDVVIAAGVSMAKTSTGTYQYTFTPVVRLVEHTIWVKVVYNRKTTYYEILYTPPAEDLTASSPSEVLHYYLTNTALLFTDPADGSTWPLYINSMPDGNGVANTCACVSDTPGVFDGKDMRTNINQHYGIQFRFRAMNDVDARTKASTVESSLRVVHNVLVNVASGETYNINNLSQTTAIVKLGIDDKGRSHYSINYLLSMKEV